MTARKTADPHGIAAPLLPLAVPIGLLDELPGNPNIGDVDAVARSYERFGQRKPVVAVASGRLTSNAPADRLTVIAGNTQLRAAQRLGWTHLAVLPTEDDEVTAKAFALADNRTADLGSTDNAALLAMLQAVEGVDPGLLAAASYVDDDLKCLMLILAQERGKNRDPDAVPSVPPTSGVVTQRGDVWLLGQHRLICGDATDPTTIATVMGHGTADMVWTDPPYGVKYVGKTADALTLSNDDAAGLPALLRDSFAAISPACAPGAAIYVAHPAGALSMIFGQAFLGAGWRLHQSLIWLKDRFVLGHADYHYRHEPILYGYAPGGGRRGRGRKGWFGDNASDSVFEIPRPARSSEHPTMKPVALISRMIENSAVLGGIVLDPFAGSGSTLIACHVTGRVARLVELDPAYCDVICRRWHEHAGQAPVLEATGREVRFAAADPLEVS